MTDSMKFPKGTAVKVKPHLSITHYKWVGIVESNEGKDYLVDRGPPNYWFRAGEDELVKLTPEEEVLWRMTGDYP